MLQALPGVFGGADTASGAVQAALHGQALVVDRRWPGLRDRGRRLALAGRPRAGPLARRLAPASASPACCSAASRIGAKGWAFEWMNAGFGALAAGQFGIGLGAALTLVALLMLLGAGMARLGFFRGDVFVASAVVFCGVLLALFVALPVLRALAGAFFNEAGDFALGAVWERIGNERTWGLSCLIAAAGSAAAWPGTRCSSRSPRPPARRCSAR